MNRLQLPLKAVLFDLDGTLVDTAGDLVAALNRLRQQEGLPDLPYEQLKLEVSNGANALLQIGFGISPDDPAQVELRSRLLDLYAADIARHSQLFTGLDVLLDHLQHRTIPWGIITNKPRRYTDLLLAALKLQAAVVVCPDDLGIAKPDPAPLLHAARQLDIEPSSCVYIGDHERDIQAGRAAGMHTLVAGFGYISPDQQPANWQADALVASVAELNSWVMARLPA